MAATESMDLLEFSGPRENVDGVKADQLLALVKDIKNPTKIRLSNKSYDIEAATKIAQYLETLEGVKIADISDIIAGKSNDDGMSNDILRIISGGLKKFDLVEVDVSDNALGPAGVLACKDILSKTTLEKLYMCNDGLSAESCVVVSDILRSSGTCASLKVPQIYTSTINSYE
jgi:Ran GTPase-activating protein (RanGAP) involved in mRNA processing and transport